MESRMRNRTTRTRHSEAPTVETSTAIQAQTDTPRHEALDQAWKDLQPAQAMAPLELIQSEAINKTGTANQGLSVEDAWELAMAFREPLLNKVRLESGRQGPQTSIVESIAWIRFKIYLADLAQMSVARAAAVIWSALASCPGYGGGENPVFWKSVFSEHSKRLQVHSMDRSDKDIVKIVTDSVGFFDQPGLEFPRFLLNAYDVEDVDKCLSGLKLFCGVGDDFIAPEVQEKLDALLSRLRPFKDDARINRLPEVGLVELNRHNLAGRDNRGGLGSQLLYFVATVNAGTSVHGRGGLSHAPSGYRFRLSQLTITSNYELIKCEADTYQIVDLLQYGDVQIGSLPLDVAEESAISAAAKARLANSLVRAKREATQGATTSVKLGKKSKLMIPALLSALPLATSTHSIDFVSDKLDDHDLMWLAYAMFHPDSATSSWRALKLEVLQISKKSVFILESMARGNNLEALLLGSEPTNTAYCSAYIRFCDVRAEPRDSAAVIEEHVTSYVDVCGVSSTDPSTWKTWVGVIIPGYGIGWVRSRRLEMVKIRPPSPSHLVSLTIRQTYRHGETPNGPEHLPAYLSVVGTNLQYLDVAEYCEIKSTSIIRSIMAQCPALSAFVLQHTGSLWAGPVEAEDRNLPRLRELELRLPSGAVFEKPSLDHICFSWSHLEALRVRPYDEDRYPHSLPAIESVLLHATRLRYFHWRRGFMYLWGGTLPCSYMQTLAWSTQLLNMIDWKDDYHLYLDDTSRVRCVVAILSVGAIAIGEPLSRDVMGHIFQFIPARLRRVIAVEPKSSWLQRDSEYRIILY